MFPWRWLALLSLIPLSLSANAGVKVKLTQKGLDYGEFESSSSVYKKNVFPPQMWYTITWSWVTVHNVTASDLVFLSISSQRARCGVSAGETEGHQCARCLGETADSHRQGPLQFDWVRQGSSHLYTHYTDPLCAIAMVYLTLFTSFESESGFDLNQHSFFCLLLRD